MANGGGGGGGTGTTDLTDYHNKTATNSLLNAKLNVNYPQDMAGTLRIGHIAGTSKIIWNAVSSDKEFYVNGDGQINGNMTVLSLDSSTHVKGSSLISNTLNTNNTNNIFFKSNGNDYLEFDGLNNEFIIFPTLRIGVGEFYELKGNLIGNNDSETDLKIRINSIDFMTFNVANDNIEVDKDIELHSSRLKSNILDTWSNADMEIKRNNVDYLKLGGTLGNLEVPVGLSCDTYDTIGNADATFRRNFIDFFYLRNGNVELNSGIDLVVPAQVQANTYNTDGNNSCLFLRNGDEYMRFRKTEDDILITKKVKANNDITVENGRNLIARDVAIPTGQSLNIRTGGVSKLGLSTTSLTLPVGLNLYGDIIYGNAFRARQENTDTIFYGGNTAGNSNIEYFRFNKTNETVNYTNDIVVANGKKLQCNIFDATGNNDVEFQRVGVPYINFIPNKIECKKALLLSGGSGKVDMYESLETTNNFLRIWNRDTTNTPITVFGLGASSNIFSIHPTKVQATQPINCSTYNSDGNSDVEFQRANNTFMSFKASLIEATKQLTITTGGTQAKFEHTSGNYTVFYAGNHIDTYATGATPQRLNINYYSKGDVMIGDGATPSDFSINKFPIAGKALAVAGLINTDTGIETDGIDTATSTDLYIKRDGIDYIQLGGTWLRTRCLTGCQSDIYDSLGNSDVKFRRNGIDFFYLRNGQVELNVDLVGEVIDTSDKTKKYDIKNIDTNFTDIIKSIEPKTFKMIDEKEKGINKNHIGFVADDLVDVIPNEWENIVIENNDNVKQLNYIKLNSILWGVCREQQSKIEHLETRLFEVENFIKDFIKPKPKPKAKNKSK